MGEMTPHEAKLLAAAERVVTARRELAEAEKEWQRLLNTAATRSTAERFASVTNAEKPSNGQTTGAESANSASPADTATATVLKVISGLQQPEPFAAIYAGVLTLIPGATKFAVRAALAKYRKSGEVSFADNKYSVAEQKENPGKPPAKVAARGRSVSGGK